VWPLQQQLQHQNKNDKEEELGMPGQRILPSTLDEDPHDVPALEIPARAHFGLQPQTLAALWGELKKSFTGITLRAFPALGAFCALFRAFSFGGDVLREKRVDQFQQCGALPELSDAQLDLPNAHLEGRHLFSTSSSSQ
jgi:hypothetical protein